MDRQYIREHQVIERYLRGTLTPAEEQGFEEAYLADPELLRELELTERLAQGVKALGQDARIARRSERAKWLEFVTSPQYAAAASVLLAVALAFSAAVYLENRSLRDIDVGSLVAGTTTRVVPLMTLRGGAVSSVSAPENGEWTVLVLDDPGLGYDRYRAVVWRTGDPVAVVWTQDPLIPGYDETLPVGIPGRLLVPGDYEIELAGRMSDWPDDRDFDAVTRTPFRVVPRE